MKSLVKDLLIYFIIENNLSHFFGYQHFKQKTKDKLY